MFMLQEEAIKKYSVGDDKYFYFKVMLRTL